jgi:hypothetical protein
MQASLQDPAPCDPAVPPGTWGGELTRSRDRVEVMKAYPPRSKPVGMGAAGTRRSGTRTGWWDSGACVQGFGGGAGSTARRLRSRPRGRRG